MKTTKTITINTTGDKVWEVFAHDFNNAYKWMASIPKSFGKDNGTQYPDCSSAGRVCELDNNPNGLKAKESFLSYSEEDRTCTVLIEFLNTPFGFPLVQNVAEFSLTEQGNNQSVVTFSVMRISVCPAGCSGFIRPPVPASSGQANSSLT